jgi:hypothetical protein
VHCDLLFAVEIDIVSPSFDVISSYILFEGQNIQLLVSIPPISCLSNDGEDESCAKALGIFCRKS